MLRAYQSPCSTPDCGPQCDQMPNFASPYHAGISYFVSESTLPVNGPAVSGSETGVAEETAGAIAPCANDIDGLRVAAEKRAMARRLVKFTLALSPFSKVTHSNYSWGT